MSGTDGTTAALAPATASARGRRWWWLAATAAGCALGLAVAFLGIGRWLEAPGESASKADVIVLLGGDSIARLEAGVDLYRRGMAPRLLLAGAESASPAADPVAPNRRLDHLVAAGVPRGAIIVDPRAHNSREEAAAALAMMREAGWRKALVVSDPPHMRRLSWIWERAFAGAEVSYVLVPSKPWWWHGGEWWHDEWAREFVRTEVVKIGYYAVVQ